VLAEMLAGERLGNFPLAKEEQQEQPGPSGASASE
jgi:hypothetical protein